MTTLQQLAKPKPLRQRPPTPQRVRDDYLRFLPWVFLTPALAIYSVVVVYPMAYSSYLSLFRWDGISPTKVFVGLQNYVTLFTQNEVFWIALRNNAVWLVAALLLPTSIGLGLALLLNSKFRGSHVFRSIFYFPAVLSLAVVGLIWTWIYHPDLGLLNQALTASGLKGLTRNWLSDPQIALYPVIIAATWSAVGLPMLLYLAGLQTIPEELHEAAKIDGAGPIRRFVHVTFPLLRETTLIVLAITAINALKAYDIVYAMTNGGPANKTQLLSTWMYFLTYNYNQVGLGTAIAVVLFSLTLIFAIPYIRFMTRKT
ncbi:MAG: sugar ABC transporter permease [Verrucomicrobia bacterium]|nr:sugar ABC transporter permease [Verrucomicrobiota bacterium]MBV8641050.1 sugar ABC transporter permease [Verrucomicrobiota bacterium]